MRATLKSKLFAVTAAILLIIAGGSAKALQFEWVPLESGAAAVGMSGEILPGDFSSLGRFIEDNRYHRETVIALLLNSRGGNISEAFAIAEFVAKTGLMTVVPAQMSCGSACFIIFASGQRRAASSTAFIAVHSARDRAAGETSGAKAATIDMARFFADLGLPDSRLERLSEHPPINSIN